MSQTVSGKCKEETGAEVINSNPNKRLSESEGFLNMVKSQIIAFGVMRVPPPPSPGVSQSGVGNPCSASDRHFRFVDKEEGVWGNSPPSLHSHSFVSLGHLLTHGETIPGGQQLQWQRGGRAISVHAPQLSLGHTQYKPRWLAISLIQRIYHPCLFINSPVYPYIFLPWPFY